MSLSDNDVNVGSSSATNCTALLGDADGEAYACVRAGSVWVLFVPAPLFCCESKDSLKYKAY